MSRSDRFTIETRKKERYSDFLINFDRNPVTGYLAKAVNEQAIEQSLRNLILTNQGDWPFESSVGSKVKASLFEQNDFIMQNELKSAIEETISNHEPRVSLVDVVVSNNANDNNRVNIQIIYSIINIPNETFTLNYVVSRVR